MQDRADDLRRGLAVEQVLDQDGPVSGRERRQRDRGGVRQAAAPVRTAFEQVRARHAEDERGAARPGDDGLDQLEEARVGPVDVLDQREDGTVGRPRLEVPLPGPGDRPARRVGVRAGERVGRQLHADRRQQDPGDAEALLAGEARVQMRARLLQDRLVGVAVEDAGVGLEDLGERPVRQPVAVGKAPPTEHPSPVVGQDACELVR
jgi:hypothetical protein